MAVANRIEKRSFGNRKEILIAPELAFTIGCLVGNTGISAGSDGRKIIKAGTPVGGATSVLTNRQTVLQKEATDVQGILLHDIDVTDGDANATIVLKGAIDLLKIDETTRALITSTVTGKLPGITFMNGNL